MLRDSLSPLARQIKRLGVEDSCLYLPLQQRVSIFWPNETSLHYPFLTPILTPGKINLPERGCLVKLPDVIAKLVEIHQHDQRESGQDDADKVTPSCCPLTDLQGFD